jgi:CYTH domain-containing protein/predicted ATPase
MSKKPIPVIAITGGPCAGKTTVMNFLRQKLQDLGFMVFVVPEAATEFIMAGAAPTVLGGEFFQEQLVQHIVEQEDRYKKMAARFDRPVILCDRGAMDGAAYVPKGQFDIILKHIGYDRVQLRDERYAGVIFLRSVAVGKPELYTLENNAARVEKTPEEAAALDERTLDVWMGSPHLRVIDNSTDLEGKIARTFEAVCRVLGIPEPVEIERKWVVKPFDLSRLPSHTASVEIVQDYLVSRRSDVHEERVRARGQNGSMIYYHTAKRDVAPGVRAEYERQITKGMYLQLLRRRDPLLKTIAKTRHCFVYENQYFELDELYNEKRFMLLELELSDMKDCVVLPPFLEAHALDVTGDKLYSNYSLARQLADAA